MPLYKLFAGFLTFAVRVQHSRRQTQKVRPIEEFSNHRKNIYLK